MLPLSSPAQPAGRRGLGQRDDAFQPIAWLDADILSSAFRQQVLAKMVSKRRLSAEFSQKFSNR